MFPLAFSIDQIPVGIDGQQVVGLDLGPERAESIQQEATRVPGYDQAEMVVDALIEALHCGGAEYGRKLLLCRFELGV